MRSPYARVGSIRYFWPVTCLLYGAISSGSSTPASDTHLGWWLANAVLISDATRCFRRSAASGEMHGNTQHLGAAAQIGSLYVLTAE